MIKYWAQSNFQGSTLGIGAKLAVGQIFSGSIFLVIALVSKFNQTSIILVTICGILLGLIFVEKKLVTDFLNKSSFRPSKTHVLGTMVFLLILAPQFIRLMSRPVSDALAYYLVQPKLIALTHQLTSANQFEAFLQSSALIELNNAAVFTFSGEIGMRTYTFISGVLLFRVVWEICRHFMFGQHATRITLFFLATSTFLMNTLADGKTDNVSSFWFMAAFLVLAAGLKDRNRRLIVLFGVLLGFSILSKISFIVLIPALTYYFLAKLNQKTTKNIASGFFFALIGLLLPIASHLLKNQVVFSASLAPFFSQTGEQSTQLLSQEWFSSENTAWIVATYPLALLFGQYPMQYGNLTPFAVMGVPILYAIRTLNRSQKGLAKDLFLMGFMTVGLWVLLKPSVLAPRYISPALIFILMAIGLLASKNIEDISSQRIKALLIILALGHLSFTSALAIVSNDTEFYSSSQNPESLMYDYVNELPKNSGLIYLKTYNASMLSSQSLLCSSVIRPFDLDKESTGGPGIWDDLYSQGFRYVVLDKVTHKDLSEIQDKTVSNSGPTTVTRINFSKNYILYKITLNHHDFKSKKVSCEKP